MDAELKRLVEAGRKVAEARAAKYKVRFVTKKTLDKLLAEEKIFGPVDTYEFNKLYPRTGEDGFNSEAVGWRAGAEAHESAQEHAFEPGYDIAFQNHANVIANDQSWMVEASFQFYVKTDKPLKT